MISILILSKGYWVLGIRNWDGVDVLHNREAVDEGSGHGRVGDHSSVVASLELQVPLHIQRTHVRHRHRVFENLGPSGRGRAHIPIVVLLSRVGAAGDNNAILHHDYPPWLCFSLIAVANGGSEMDLGQLLGQLRVSIPHL
jgi:hypothetical protein